MNRVTALFAGLGSAFITIPQRRSVVVGIRESAISFGAVAGPLLAAFIGRWLAPRGIFTVAALTTLAAVILAFVVLMPQGQVQYPASSCDCSVRKTDQLVSIP